jgi:hypothetical protein
MFFLTLAGYHLYTDDTHFTYSLTLVRTDILKNQNQYYRLKVRYCFRLPNSNTTLSPATQLLKSTCPPHLNFSSPHCCAHIPLPIHGLKPCSFSNPMPNRTIIGV